MWGAGYWSLQSQAGFEGSAPAPSTYGAWLHLDRILWQGPSWRAHPDGLGNTHRLSPAVGGHRSHFWAVGLVHYGLVPSRRKDPAMLALYQGRYSQAFMGSLGSPQSAVPRKP